MAAEHGDSARRGFWASWPQAGVPAGNLLAAAVLSIMAAVQSEADFLSWGWRVPFVLSALLVIVGWYIRNRIAESPMFEAEIEASEAPSKVPAIEVLRERPKALVLGAGLRVGENISYYILTVFSLTYLVDVSKESRSLALNALLIGAAVQFIAIPLLALVSDRIGRRPVYALGAFWVLFTPLLAVLQILWPDLPFLFGGYAAIAWSMILYEVIHAIDHWPYEWWSKATEHPRFGRFWRPLYGFHHMHHANIGCNEAIGGFFALPVPDWIFGTYHQPKELLLHDRLATARDFAIGEPRRFVRWLDRWAQRRETAIVRRPK